MTSRPRAAIERLARAARLANELSIATLAAIQGSQWMPKPAEFRRLVQGKLDERQRRKERWMLHALGGKGQKPFQRKSEPVRVRTLRDAFRRVGNKAALYERQLAEIETRAPKPWAVEEARSAP